MLVKQQLVPASVAKKVTYGGVNMRTYITVHQTGNTNRGANAQAHANLQSNGNSRKASWHETVDDKECIQSFPHTAQCWHAGDGRGVGNLHSIAVEICINKDGNYVDAVRNGALRVAQLRIMHGIPAAHVVQHNRWSGKNCPAQIRKGQAGIDWAEFLRLVDAFYAELSNKPAPAPAPTPAPTPAPAATGLEALAREVIAGKWGNNPARAARLLKAGHNPVSVQRRVNQILSSKPASPAKPATPARKTNTQLAAEVIAGKWGNGAARKRRLKAAGYDYAAIQKIVNQRMKK